MVNCTDCNTSLSEVKYVYTVLNYEIIKGVIYTEKNHTELPKEYKYVYCTRCHGYAIYNADQEYFCKVIVSNNQDDPVDLFFDQIFHRNFLTETNKRELANLASDAPYTSYHINPIVENIFYDEGRDYYFSIINY